MREACRTWAKRKFKAVKWWERQKAPNSTRTIRAAVSSFSIALNSQPKTLQPTSSCLIQWLGTLTCQERRQRGWLNSKVRAALRRKWPQFRVPTKSMTGPIYYFSTPTCQGHTRISCTWNRSWAHQRIRSGIKSGWSSCGWAMRRGWRKAVSWTKISAWTWFRTRTSPRTWACSSKIHPCEPTTRRRRTIWHKAIINGKLSRPGKMEKGNSISCKPKGHITMYRIFWVKQMDSEELWWIKYQKASLTLSRDQRSTAPSPARWAPMEMWAASATFSKGNRKSANCKMIWIPVR